MHRANQMKQEQVKAREKHEQEIKTMKQTVKVAASNKEDDMFGVQREPVPKSHVKKGSVTLQPLLMTRLIQWNPSITDTIGTQHFVRYSKVSLTQGLLVYFR